MKQEANKKLLKKIENVLDFHLVLWDNRVSAKVDTKKSNKGSKMANTTLTVGSQFTTAKSGVVGVIQEIVKNPSGSARVRLDVNGQPRWTTVK